MTEQTTTEVQPQPGTPEHDQAMAQKFDSLQPEQPKQETGERPGWLPEKFKSPEDLAKAYSELEQKLGGKPKTEAQPAPDTPKEGDQPDLSINDKTDEAKEAVVAAGLDYDALSAEFSEQGQLTEESYQKLEKAGIPKNIVDSYIAGQEALAQTITQTAFSEAGGEEQYRTITEWARSNLKPAEIAAYNKAVNGNVEEMRLAVAGLRAKYESTNGREPSLVAGNNTPANNLGFKSKYEITQAMKDPRYAKDPAYREEVTRRLANTNW